MCKDAKLLWSEIGISLELAENMDLGPPDNVPPLISEYQQEMDENISTAALMAWVNSAWLHLSLSFPLFPAIILKSKAVH